MNQTIRISALLGVLIVTPCAGEEPSGTRLKIGLSQPDPRSAIPRFIRGSKPGAEHGGYIVIAWAHPPAGSEQSGYQIWGDNRIVDRQTLWAALGTLMEKRPRDIYLVGNEWAAGSELDPLLQQLSKRHSIDVFGGSTFGFDTTDFRTEPREVEALVSAAINKSGNAQQVGTGKPSTRPESKSEGGDKPQPEAEGRSR